MDGVRTGIHPSADGHTATDPNTHTDADNGATRDGGPHADGDIDERVASYGAGAADCGAASQAWLRPMTLSSRLSGWLAGAVASP